MRQTHFQRYLFLQEYMKGIFIFIGIVISSLHLCLAQVAFKKTDSMAITAKTIFGIDTYGAIYYTTTNQTLHKKSKDSTITYTNFHLNTITSVDAFNPLKINVFYGDFNTVLILDNRMTEIVKIDFNTLQDYKNVSFVSTGSDNSLWLFNQDLQLLELYDYKQLKTKLKTVPVSGKALALKSDFNYCYLLTDKYLYIYNYFGSLVKKIKNNTFKKLAFSKSSVVLSTEKMLYYLDKKTFSITPIETIKFFDAFLVTNETLYIYHKNHLYTYITTNN